MQATGSPRGPTGAGSSTEGPPVEAREVTAERRTCRLCLAFAHPNPDQLCDVCAAAGCSVNSLNAICLTDGERRELSDHL
eukprot:2284824-Alexandrium_andersonii.AAC.1